MQKSRMERLFDKGRRALKEEMDIVQFFTELRQLKRTVQMKLQLTKEEYD